MFELKTGEYADVSHLSFDKRKQLFPNIDRTWLQKKYMIVFKNSSYNDTDCYCDDNDLRNSWLKYIRYQWHCYKERRISYVNNLGEM